MLNKEQSYRLVRDSHGPEDGSRVFPTDMVVSVIGDGYKVGDVEYIGVDHEGWGAGDVRVQDLAVADTDHILILGNPKDGFTIIGPFPTTDDALEYAGDYGEGEWWLDEIQGPRDHFNQRWSPPSEQEG